MPTRVLIAGLSTRAAAESAAKAGFAVTAIDAFGDLDQHPGVDARSAVCDLGRQFSPLLAARTSREIECDAVAYLSNFENHPAAVHTLARGRALWGNPPEVLRRVRNPWLLAETLRRRGFPTARVLPNGSNGSNDSNVPNGWLVKPRRSGGGRGVRPWRGGAVVSRGCYVQERIDGEPGSVVFVAAAGRARVLGLSRQLVGDANFGAGGFEYCGSVLAVDPALLAKARPLVAAVVEEFDLVGVNGIDFVLRDGHPVAVEVNPRWTASMELLERATGDTVFAAHAEACANGTVLDAGTAPIGARTWGKAIVFARHAASMGNTREWLSDPDVRDVPHPGERIRRGRPVCTVFASAQDAGTCRLALTAKAQSIHAEIERWRRSAA